MKAWYSFAEGETYEGNEPAFFDIDGYDWKNQLEQHAGAILQELKQVLQKKDNGTIPYFNQTLASDAKNWTILPLFVWGKKYELNCNLCPVTSSLVESIPEMTSCSFSILKPNTSIKPHHGDSNVMYRCHLTLENKNSLPDIGIKVKGETRGWNNGELFAFCDAHEHKVWNNTNDTRYILIIDILRAPFASQKKEICGKINGTLFWQIKFQKFYFIKHLPRFVRRAMMNLTGYLYRKN